MKTVTLGALAILCAGIASTPAPAAPLGVGFMSGLSDQQNVVEQVGYKKRWHHNNNNWGGNNWGGNWHHRRHHHDNDNWGWWGVPLGLGLGLALTAPYYGGGYNNGYGNSHVDYCMRRYRSYDPRTNTFMGYDGYRHECVGPY
jgi:BA14K-like protein